MSALDRLVFKEAQSAFAVANSPLFLLRKLRADQAIADAARSYSIQELATALNKALQKRPRSLGAAVRPYALLVALSMKNDLSALKEQMQARALFHEWYGYLASVLVETFRPTTIATLDGTAQYSPARTSYQSKKTATNRQLLHVGR